MSKKCKFPGIRAELKQRELESRAIRTQIHESSGMARWGFWADKRRYGCDTRDLLLGYAFLRGMPYRVVEAKTQPDSGPYATYIQRCLEARGHAVETAAIEQWLAVPPPEVAEEPKSAEVVHG